MVSLISENWNDFTVNMAAGLLIFVLDILLIAIALPIILKKLDRFTWRKTRAAFVSDRLSQQRYIIDKMQSRAKNFFDTRPVVFNDTDWQDKCYQRLFATTIAELQDLELVTDREAAIYAVSFGPSDHLAFVNWRAALIHFREELSNLNNTGWAHILTRNVSRIREPDFMLPLTAAFDHLNTATAEIIAAGGISATITANEGQVSLLPVDTFNGFYWDGIRTTFLLAAGLAQPFE